MNDTVHGLHIGGLPMQFNLQFHGCTVHCVIWDANRNVALAWPRHAAHAPVARIAESPEHLERNHRLRFSVSSPSSSSSLSWGWRGSRCVRCWLKRTQSTTAPA